MTYKLLLLPCSYFELDHPSLLPQNKLTAPEFWHSPLPLRAGVWQWATIHYWAIPSECVLHFEHRFVIHLLVDT